MMHAQNFVIVRPQAQADMMVKQFEAMGAQAVACPVIDYYEDAKAAASIEHVNAYADAVIVTSKQTLMIAQQHGLSTELALYVTGNRLADAARAAGYQTIYAANDSAHSIIESFADKLCDARYCTYLRADKVAQDLAAMLAKGGTVLHEYVMYRSRIVHTLPCPLCSEPENTIFLCYSARHADVLTALLRSAHQQLYMDQSMMLCISSALEQHLTMLGWKRVRHILGTECHEILHSVLR